MNIVQWLLKRLRKRIEPLELKYHLEDIVIAYDDVDLILFSKTSKKKK